MSQVWKDGRSPKVTCKAHNKMGEPCKRPPIKGSTVCRTHGGAAPHVRDAARVRILMSADLAAAKLIEIIQSKKVDDRTKLLAVKDLLDRANLSGTQNVEVGITKRDFSDVTADVVMDLFDLDEDDEPLALAVAAEDIEDADVVDEDDAERWEREDAQTERAQEIARMKRGTPIPPDPDVSHARSRVEAERMRPEPKHRVSMADPHADRFPETGGRRTMSPKRREQRQKERGEG